MINTKEMTYIGSFSVDSGQAIVGDPCYLNDWQDKYDNFEEYKNSEGQYGYLGACHATLRNNYGVLGMGKAVAFTTGYGDGYYEVFANLNDEGRIAQVVIDFIGDEVDEELEAVL